MFRLQDDFTYVGMPVHFGPGFFGGKFDPTAGGILPETKLSITYETDRAQLENYIPEEMELRAPEITVGFSKFTEVNFLFGGGYNAVTVGAPVRFHGKTDELDGIYPLVMWENKTFGILTGREQTGIPKIYADIGDLRVVKPYYATTVSYEGNAFLTMSFEATDPTTGHESDSTKAQTTHSSMIGWRYIPKAGAPGAELSQFVQFPCTIEVETTLAGNGSLRWIEQTPEQNPFQVHIINSLASLPMKKVTQAALTTGRMLLHTFKSRVLE